jgi:hypothetical protein
MVQSTDESDGFIRVPPICVSEDTPMTYKRDEYSVHGHKVVIQQVRGPDSSIGASKPSGWIDGDSIYALHAADHLPFDVSHKSDYGKVEAVASFMITTSQRFCKECNNFRDAAGFVSTHFAGVKCGVCNHNDKRCPESDDGSHDYECRNPHQKHNARVATKYSCKNCGKKKKSTPTG